MDSPKEAVVETSPYLEASPEDNVVYEKKGTSNDARDMYRLGKPQQVRRVFKGLTIWGFILVLLCTWEVQLGVAGFGLLNGGTAGLIWMYLAAFVGFGFVIASMAEMASMAPTSGGQYHWVSEFAPKSAQKFLSYMVGWLAMLGWQVGCASIAYVSGTGLQGMILMNNPDYVPKRWHGTLLAVAMAMLAICFNTALARRLPLVEGVIVIVHIFGFFGVNIVLWVMADRGNAKAVFTEFLDIPGWGSTGLSCLVGWLGAVSSFVGSDAAAHMSEEVRDASYTLPRAMMWSWLVNGIMGWVMGVTLCFCIGGNVMTVLATPTGYPYLEIFLNATGSPQGMTAMGSIFSIVGIFAAVCNVASCSRQLFAFARDKGVPFSSFFAKIHPTLEIPLNAVVMTVTISIILALINIGSTIAFNQIISLGVGAMMTSYMISIGCIFVKRLRGEQLLPCRWSLGKWGIVVNGMALLFCLLAYVMAFFPPTPRPDPAGMNWSCLIYGTVIIFSLVYYYVRGRHVYVGPVEYVRKGV